MKIYVKNTSKEENVPKYPKGDGYRKSPSQPPVFTTLIHNMLQYTVEKLKLENRLYNFFLECCIIFQFLYSKTLFCCDVPILFVFAFR